VILPLLAALIVFAPADTGRAVKFTANAGFVNTTGNTEITSMNFGNTLEAITKGWKFTQTGGVVYGKSDGELNTALWIASVRGSRDLSEDVSLFVVTEFDRNTFSGISSRYAPQLGLSMRLLDGPTDQLRGELSGGYTWQNAVAVGQSAEYAAGRGAVIYKRQLGPKASVAQALEFLPNFKTGEDLRVNSETAVTAPLASGVAMKVSYVVRYDGLPEPTFRTTDRILTTGIQLAF
jgi:putative salt-induced outer membrane protein